jgi:hypothetical protein
MDEAAKKAMFPQNERLKKKDIFPWLGLGIRHFSGQALPESR